MKKQVGVSLIALVMSVNAAFAQGAADRLNDRLDTSRARNESRYGTVGNAPQTETIVREKVITVPVPPSGGDARSAGFAADGTRKPKTKRVVVKETVTVTKPAPLRINPY